MNVLSYFDGMSCGQIALSEMGFKVDNYFAAEIDKYAIEQTKHNFKDTIHIGSVVDVKIENLPKIDLFIGGSPCQGFSFAGKQLNFNDPRSKLFFEYANTLKKLRDKNSEILFLLENVNMKKEHLRIISECLGVFPVRINSSLVSAQIRDRWYWTNIKTKKIGLFGDVYSDIPPPKDRNIVLADIIESGFVDREKSYCLDANYFKGSNIEQYLKKARRQLVFSIKEQRTDEAKKIRRETGSNPFRAKEQVVREDGKVACLQTSLTNDHTIYDGLTFRKLTVKECSRLQNIPDWYEWIVSNTQAYKMLGNGWTVDVIKHIFSFIPNSD